MSQNRRTITIKFLEDISEIKGNQAMKFGQYFEYKLSKIFLKES